MSFKPSFCSSFDDVQSVSFGRDFAGLSASELRLEIGCFIRQYGLRFLQCIGDEIFDSDHGKSDIARKFSIDLLLQFPGLPGCEVAGSGNHALC
jgi:hypothetical protein